MFFLIVFLMISLIVAREIIEIPYTYRYSTPVSDCVFIKEGIHSNLGLNTYISYSLLKSQEFNKIARSNIIDNKTIQLQNKYPSYQYQTDIIINNTLIQNFTVFLFDTDKYYIDELGIALSYQFEDESFSLIHTLYNRHLIDHKQFAFDNNGTFYIGGIANNSHKQYNHKGKCNIHSNDDKWTCSLQSIQLDNKEYLLNFDAIFHSEYKGMFYSTELFDIMVNDIFKEQLKSNICEIKHNMFDFRWLLCDDRIKSSIDYITVIFDDMEIRLEINDLFLKDKYRNEYMSQFFSYPLEKREKSIFIGFAFNSIFNYTVYDYEEKSISFYSDYIDIHSKKVYQSTNTIKGICIVMLFLCLSNVLYLYLNKQHRINNYL